MLVKKCNLTVTSQLNVSHTFVGYTADEGYAVKDVKSVYFLSMTFFVTGQ